MAWAILVVAGVLEIGMASFLKLSKGFTELPYTLAFAVCGGLSFFLLSQAIKDLPVGVAYAVWTGIGAAGTALVGIIFLGEAAEIGKLVSIGLIVSGVIGLQLLGGGH
jgi:quaternary ammonium compound-resistance protein SugE